MFAIVKGVAEAHALRRWRWGGVGTLKDLDLKLTL